MLVPLLKASSKPLPVLFFVHGGDLTLGAGTDSGPAAIYGGSWALAATGKAIPVVKISLLCRFLQHKIEQNKVLVIC